MTGMEGIRKRGVWAIASYLSGPWQTFSQLSVAFCLPCSSGTNFSTRFQRILCKMHVSVFYGGKRYDVGNYTMKVGAIKLYWVIEGSIFVLMTIYTLYRVTLIAVLKRVVEINEDLMLRIITISVFGFVGYGVMSIVPGYRFNSVASAVSGSQATRVSVYSCFSDHPLTQE